MNRTIHHPLSARNDATLSRDMRLIFGLLEKLRGGLLEVRLPDGSSFLFGDGETGVSLHVHDPRWFGRVLARGDIGMAEAYLDGQWDSPDVASLLTLLAQNRAVIGQAVYGRWRSLLAARIRHAFNRNSRAGSRRNIMAHYDLGNAFYQCWLDETMSYSAALYGDDPSRSLADAQRAKYRRILDRLGAGPGSHVLEIGCGWGGFAEAAHASGLTLTGVTLSPAQLAWATARVPGADLRLQDYRDIDAQYDHVVSIEMFEAVGERWWPAYFKALARSLKVGGKAIVQSITVHDDLFGAYRTGTDFIQQYIFPGGMLPSRQVFRHAAARQGLAVNDEYAFGADYARTLAVWRQGFERQWPAIQRLGFDDTFHRLWRFYLSYCEAGFRAGSVDVVQFELAHI